MKRDAVIDLMKQILRKQGKSTAITEEMPLGAAGFRSIDFSELVLRVEMASGIEFTFDAAPLREITHVRDVLDFVDTLHGQASGTDESSPSA